MEKLFDIFQTEKLRVKDDILRIDKLIHSDLFLKGIGANASEIKTTINFPIVRNYLKAAEMLVSETVYDMPKPWPYQCFMEVWEEENGRIMFGSHVSDTKGSAIDNYLEEKRQNYGDFSGELFGLIEEKYSQHNIKEFLLGTNASKDDIEDWIAEDPEDVICNSFPNEIEGFINGLIKTSFYIGLSNSAFYTRVLEAFETGGIPAGWVGPTPENGGGLPKDCMQLLHYGS